MFNGDPYDNGTPKYSSATDIYDALREMSTGEEIGILGEMFSDISWDGQDYYYTDNAYKLVERWDSIIDYGDKMWLMDVAAWQLSDGDANEWIYQILCNADLAKRIGFKKIFVEEVLNTRSNKYAAAVEAFEFELQDLDRFDFMSNRIALQRALETVEYNVIHYPYDKLCTAVYNRLKGLKLETERQLIAESRAILTSYDDFMFGLRSNQALYTEQERAYQAKIAQLQSKYDNAVKLLLMAAQEQGVVLRLPEAPLQLAEIENKEETP